MKKVIATGILALVLGLVFTSKTLAYQGDPNVRGPYCTDEQYKQVQAALEKKDYNTWKKLMGDRRIARKIDNQQKFNKFVEMRKLMLQGKTDEAAKIRAELGLGGGMGYGRGYNRK